MTIDQLAAQHAEEQRRYVIAGIAAAERQLADARARRARTEATERHLATLRARAAS